ncbi:MAG: class II aldolase/adducin family protein [Nitrososphaerota archaeon]
MVEAGKAMHEAGLATATWGNISALTRDRRIMVITPSGFDKSRLNPHDMIVMDLNGAVIDGRHKPSIEAPMHLEIYKSLEHVYAIVHTHSPMATAVGVAGEEIPPIILEMVAEIGDRIPLAEYACAGTRRLGRALVEVLRSANAAIMRNHGVIAVGPSLKAALARAILVEEAARIFIAAKILGKIEPIPDDEIKLFKAVIGEWKTIQRIQNISEWIKELKSIGAENQED